MSDDRVKSFLEWSEIALGSSEPQIGAPADHAMLCFIERGQLPAFRASQPSDATPAEFLVWCRRQFADRPQLLGGLPRDVAGRVMAAQERLLAQFDQEAAETQSRVDDEAARELMMAEFADELARPGAEHAP